MNSAFATQIVFLVVLVAVCSGPADQKEPASDQNAPPSTNNPLVPGECEGLSERDCTAEAFCTPMNAWPLDATEQCVGRRQFVECRNGLLGCDDALGHALDPSGQSWLLPSLCAPTGWSVNFDYPEWFINERVDCFPPEIPELSECAGLSENECFASAHCRAVTGQPVNTEKKCVGQKQVVDCQNYRRDCETSLAIGLDPSGQPWLFPNLCTPVGWPVDYLIPLDLEWDPDCFE